MTRETPTEPVAQSMTSFEGPSSSGRKRKVLRAILWITLAFLISMSLATCLWVKMCHRTPSKPISDTRLDQLVVKVPFRLVSGVPMVDVMVNDHGPFTFLLDTGASHVLISERLAKKLRLPKTEAKAILMDALGKPQEHPVVRVRSLRVGEAEFVHSATAVDSFGHLRGAIGADLDGILGWYCFKGCLLTLDFPSRQVVLEEGALPKPDGKDVLELVAGNSRPEVRVRIGQLEVELLIDSGSNGHLRVPESVAGTLVFCAAPLEIQSAVGSGMVRTRLARLKGRAQIGRHRLMDPIIEWTVGGKGRGLIGMNMLKHFVVTFDQANRAVRFSRKDDAPIRIPGVRTIGLTYAVRNGVAAIQIINPMAPADQLGLKVGDRLLTVNGQPFSELDNDRFAALLENEDVLALEVMRGDLRFAVEVPVAELP